MAEQITYLIIGNGIAGVTAAEILRAENAAATIGVIADDPFPVYYRPALKDYLGGKVREDKLWARPSSFYQDRNILFLPDRVVSIQPGQHSIQLQSRRQVGYRKLLLASGARSASLRCPGCDLRGVTTLRTVADYQSVLERLNKVRRVVVVGSGTLALETVEMLRQRGLQVSHLLRRRTLWSEVLDVTASDLVLQQERRAGIDVRLEEEIVEIVGGQGEVKGVTTSKGAHISCEMVLIAIGIEPNIDFIRTSDIACWRGVRIDSKMRTNARDIYAAGDVVETTNLQTGHTRVIGQWYPAIQQARAAAYSMLDQLDNDQPFNASTFYNATFLYGLDFASVGITNGSNYQEIIADPRPRTYRKVVLKDGVVVGMLAIGDRKQVLAYKRAIDHRVSLLSVSARLFADDFKLNDWLDSQGVPAAQLGVKRASDTLVRKAVAPPAAGKRDTLIRKAITLPLAGNSAVVATVAHRDLPSEQNSHKEKVVEDTMSTSPSEPTEALLVHVPDPVLRLRLSETPLSKTEVTTIGRQAGVHILIDEGSVSRHHAEIGSIHGHYVLRDLGSTNGTFVNDIRLDPATPQILKVNDQLRFGHIVRFRFLLRSLYPTAQPVYTNNGKGGTPGLAMPYALAPSAERAAQGQPVLKPDGSLLPPGAAKPVPASVVAAFKDAPALIVMPEKSKDGSSASPQVHLLKPGKRTTIGREKDNDIKLEDVVVSRHHAEIFPGPDGFYIRDLGSSNGVTVNQAKIDNPYLLSHGDRVTLGGTMIIYVDLQAGQERTQKLAVPPKKVESPPIAYSTQPAQVAPRAKKTIPLPASEQQPNVVICPRCGVANMRVARFCAGCSAPL